MIRKRHLNKSGKWLYKQYWKPAGQGKTFTVKTKTGKGKIKYYRVLKVCSIGIKRHIKIKADANPYDPGYSAYFWKRRNVKESKLLPGYGTLLGLHPNSAQHHLGRTAPFRRLTSALLLCGSTPRHRLWPVQHPVYHSKTTVPAPWAIFA